MSAIPSSLKSKFELCLNNDDLSDCEFVVGKQKCRIKGHKLLFGLSSPVFRAELYDNSKNDVTFRIDDVEVDEFKGMKHFFYTESVNFTSSLNACSLYLVSWKYVVPDLMSKCVQYIEDNVSVTDVIDVYEFSRVNNIPDIEKICTAIFRDETREIMESDRFLSADIDTLETILKLDSLNLKNELEVFKHTEKWILAEAVREKSQREKFNCIMRLIRFSTMNKDQYEKGPAMSNLLAAEEKLSITHRLLNIKSKNKSPFSVVNSHKNLRNRIFTRKEELEGDDGETDREEEKEKEGEGQGVGREVEDKENKGENEKGKEEDDDEEEEEEDEEEVLEGEVEEEEEEKKEEEKKEKDKDTQKQSVGNALCMPTNSEKFTFSFKHHFMSNIKRNFEFLGYDFEIHMRIHSFPFGFTTFHLINKQLIKLQCVVKIDFVPFPGDSRCRPPLIIHKDYSKTVQQDHTLCSLLPQYGRLKYGEKIILELYLTEL